MTTKKIDNSVKARLKQAEKEWDEMFAEVFANVPDDAPLDMLMKFGAPMDVLIKNKTAQKIMTELTAKKVTAQRDAQHAKKMQGVVLHLYYTIGLSYAQIAGTVDMSEEQVKNIINNNDKVQ